MQAKGEFLERLLQQVGEERFRAAILYTVEHHHSEYCPTIAEIRAFVPAKPEAQWNQTYPEEDRFNVFAMVRAIAQKHDMNRGRSTKQIVAKAWDKYLKDNNLEHWTWPDTAASPTTPRSPENENAD
jgi:hypothetical protein